MKPSAEEIKELIKQGMISEGMGSMNKVVVDNMKVGEWVEVTDGFMTVFVVKTEMGFSVRYRSDDGKICNNTFAV